MKFNNERLKSYLLKEIWRQNLNLVIKNLAYWEKNQVNINMKEGIIRLTKYVIRFCKANNKTLSIPLKRDPILNPKLSFDEKNFFKKNFSKEDYDFLQKNFVEKALRRIN